MHHAPRRKKCSNRIPTFRVKFDLTFLATFGEFSAFHYNNIMLIAPPVLFLRATITKCFAVEPLDGSVPVTSRRETS